MIARFLSILVLGQSAFAIGQTDPIASVNVDLPVDSGWVQNNGDAAGIVWSTRFEVPNATWVRLRFSEVQLSQPTARIRITSVQDGHTQSMHARHVRQWRNTSAYFNGNAVDIEVVADPGSDPCRVQIAGATVGSIAASPRNICGATDDRVLSTDPRAGRIVPVGCTSWLIGDANYCQLTAGHCVVSGNAEVIEFNVPISTESGAIVHPPPSDQYAVDLDSMQLSDDIEVGNDWAYFGVFENSTTGLTAYEAQADHYVLVDTVPAPVNQLLRKTGFGSTGAGVSPTYNQAQKTLAGPFTSQDGTRLKYAIDSSGGDSGSPMFLEGTNMAVAIHTNGGCAQTGTNSGTSIENAGLQAALASPTGVCIPNYFEFVFPNGLPDFVNSAGGTTARVSVIARNLYEIDPSSGTLHYDAGDGWLSVPLQAAGSGEWDIVFPSVPCARNLDFYLTFQTTTGAESTSPMRAPGTTYNALTGSSLAVIAEFDFESAPGWFVSSQNLVSGAWARATPTGVGLFGEPPLDFDGSGQCFMTGTGFEGDDVDGGPTMLWSPAVTMAGASNPVVQYARWFTNSNLDSDRLTVEFANNSIVNFVPIESVAHTEGWRRVSQFVSDTFASPGMIRARFSVSDNPNNSRTEAAIDSVLFLDITCDNACLKGDVDANGIVDGRDVSPFVATLLNPPAMGTPAFCATDMDGSNTLSADVDVPLFIDCVLEASCP